MLIRGNLLLVSMQMILTSYKTLEDDNEVYELLYDYLKDRGLTLTPDKTRITHI